MVTVYRLHRTIRPSIFISFGTFDSFLIGLARNWVYRAYCSAQSAQKPVQTIWEKLTTRSQRLLSWYILQKGYPVEIKFICNTIWNHKNPLTRTIATLVSKNMFFFANAQSLEFLQTKTINSLIKGHNLNFATQFRWHY